VRRLAREAVIFTLVGWLLMGLGSLIYLHHETWKTHDVDYKAPQTPGDTSVVPSTNPLSAFGIPAQRRPVWIYVDFAEEYEGWLSTRPKVPAQITASLKTNDVCTPGEETFGDDGVQWICVRPKERSIANAPVTMNPPTVILFDPRPPTPKSTLAVSGLLLSLYGIPGGFLAWLFYRVIYFAVKG
jgi:hypothetical protein